MCSLFQVRFQPPAAVLELLPVPSSELFVLIRAFEIAQRFHLKIFNKSLTLSHALDKGGVADLRESGKISAKDL